MTAKELLADLKLRVKDIFDFPSAAPAAPAAPASPSVPAPIVYTLADGTQIAIAQAGSVPAVGDMVTIAGVPAPEGVLTLQDGTLITVDATGTITQYTPVAPAAAATPPVPPAPPKPVVPVTQAAMELIVQKFAVGDPEQRLSNLELVCKALMESEFGYQISANERIESTNQAIAIYQSTLANQEAAMAEQKKTIDRYGETIKGLFSLVEKLVELPTANPVTLNGNKKEIFDKKEKGEAKMAAIATALKDIKHQ